MVRICPNTASCLCLVRALPVEQHQGWIEATRYLNIDLLKKHKKEEARLTSMAAWHLFARQGAIRETSP